MRAGVPIVPIAVVGNEEVVARLQKHFPDLKLLKKKSVLPFRDHFDGAFAAKLLKTS
jgi:1-acyl-sn-glycerol-3-phosphate acyltransferase